MQKSNVHPREVWGEQLFEHVEFMGNVSINSVEFSGRSFWNNAKFMPNTNALGPDFRNARWKSHANFADVVFGGDYPRMAGATFEEGATFTADDGHWPKSERLGQDKAKAAKEMVAKLRHTMAQQGLPEEAHFFFRREMGFVGQIGTWIERLPYKMFGWFSHYGQSISRPVEWLTGVFGFGVGAFARHLYYAAPLPNAFGEGAALSFSNLLPLFGFGRLYFDKAYMAELPTMLQVLAGMQTVFALPLLFCLGLGLRTRFRMR